MTNKTTRRATVEDCPDYPLTKRITELEAIKNKLDKELVEMGKVIVDVINRAEQAEAENTDLLSRLMQVRSEKSQLQAENKRLRAALEPFAKLYRERKDWHPHGDYIPRHELASNSFSGEVVRITSADCYRAEQALRGEDK